MKRSSTSRSDLAGFSLVELLTVTAIMVVLASIGFVALRSAMIRARRVACLANLRQLNLTLVQFVSDHQRYPLFLTSSQHADEIPGQRPTWLASVAQDEARSASLKSGPNGILPRSIIRCPSVSSQSRYFRRDGSEGLVTGIYGYNAYGLRDQTSDAPNGLGVKAESTEESGAIDVKPVEAKDVVAPARMISLGDSVVGYRGLYDDSASRFERSVDSLGTPESSARTRRRHGGRLTAAYCDGHLESPRIHDLFDTGSGEWRAQWNRNNRAD